MRYDTPIYFQCITPGEYNSDTGNYDDDIPVETLRYASVMDTQAETMNLIYGDIKQASKTVQIQSCYNDAFDYIRIGGKIYRVDSLRKLRTKETFVISEVQR